MYIFYDSTSDLKMRISRHGRFSLATLRAGVCAFVWANEVAIVILFVQRQRSWWINNKRDLSSSRPKFTRTASSFSAIAPSPFRRTYSFPYSWFEAFSSDASISHPVFMLSEIVRYLKHFRSSEDIPPNKLARTEK